MSLSPLRLPERPPRVGELVHLRSRRWLVEEVVAPACDGESSRVLLACADDDAQGQSLEVFWDYEIDRRILEEEGWADLAARGFDPPRSGDGRAAPEPAPTPASTPRPAPAPAPNPVPIQAPTLVPTPPRRTGRVSNGSWTGCRRSPRRAGTFPTPRPAGSSTGSVNTSAPRSRPSAGFAPAPFRDALSCALELLDAPPLAEGRDEDGRPVWTFPPLERRAATDPSWTATLDSLRVPRRLDQKLADWRRDAPVRPVVFEDAGELNEDTVHLHLEQRVAQRLLARFRAQGFVYHDLSRACLAQAKDSIPRVILLGRLCLYGRHAERLHEELVPVAARWTDPARRSEPLRAYAREAEIRTLALLDESLGGGDGRNGGGPAGGAAAPNEVIQRRLLDAAPRDVAELRPQLEPRAAEFAAVAERRLAERGEREGRDLRGTLQRQRERVVAELARREAEFDQLTLAFAREETRQLEADMRHWRRRLDRFEHDLEREPARIREFYEIRARRVEPVGLVYLWPETN